jgi:anti-sigma factor RsiW
MSCEKFEQLIALYVEGDLPETEAHVVARHLDECASCREFAAGIEETQAALKDLRLEHVGGAVFAEVREQVLREIPAIGSARLWPKFAIAAALAAALMAGLLWRVLAPAQPVQLQAAAPLVPAAPPAVEVAARRTPVHHRGGARSARVAHRVKPAPVFKSEPLVVKMLTDDPHVVIYWLVDQNGG